MSASTAEETLATRKATETLRRAALPGLAALSALGLARHLRGRLEASQLFLPVAYPSGVWDPEPFGVAKEDVWFSSLDGTKLHGW